jgi:hypothetical protein
VLLDQILKTVSLETVGTTYRKSQVKIKYKAAIIQQVTLLAKLNNKKT